jgi:preprotein translocase subunit SecF
MKTKNIIIYVIICLIIIAGIAVWDSKGFNSELQYSARYQIQLSNNEGIEISDIEDIVNEVLGDTNYFIQPVEIFGNSVSIVAEQMTEEQRDQIVEKFNEKYEYDLDKDDVQLTYIPFTRVKDVVKHFVTPGIITLAVILIYFLIRFRKIGWKEVLLKTLLYPVIAELLIYSIMAIVRIPFGRVAIALSIGLYVAVIAILTCIFEDRRNKYVQDSKNKDRKED